MKVYSWCGYLVCLCRGHKYSRIILNDQDLGELCMRCGYYEEAA